MNQSTNKNKQLFAKLGHNFANDPKIFTLSDAAFRAYIEALLYACANLTDGFIDARVAKRHGWDLSADELTCNDAEPSWVEVDGGWQIHAFCDWQMTSKQHAEKVRNGQKGGLAKAENARKSSKVVAGASVLLEQNPSKRLADKNRIEEEKNIPAYSAVFESWWEIYPRKTAKGSAYKAFVKALDRATVGELLAGVRRYADSDLPDAQFVPHAATWLNADRWNDVLPVKESWSHHPPDEDWMYPKPPMNQDGIVV